MPNFYEDLEVDEVPISAEGGQREVRPPHSATSTSGSGSGRVPTTDVPLTGASIRPSRPTSPSKLTSLFVPSLGLEDDAPSMSQTCPVCSKTMQTDNQGLNAHIDFCLSKGAIREAQAMASSGTRHKLNPLKRTPTAATKRASNRK